MRFKNKNLCISIAVFFTLVLMFPLKFEFKDGGTKKYTAILYSVTFQHSLDSKDGDYGYSVGTIVRILFFEVYNDVTFVSNKDHSQKT